MVEANADLEDALVEKPDPSRLLHPGFLQVLVALVELALVELFDALEGEFGDLFWGLLSRSSLRRSSLRSLCGRASRRSWWRGWRRRRLRRRSWRSDAATRSCHIPGTRPDRRPRSSNASTRIASRNRSTC